MKTAGSVILVIASFSCGVFLSPDEGVAALLCAVALAGISAFLIFAAPAGKNIGIAIGLSSILAMTLADLMLRSVPDAFPPYPPGLMDSLFPAEHFPRSEKSFHEIDTRLHWYGFLCFMPFSVAFLFLLTKLRSSRGKNRAQQDEDGKASPAIS